MSLFSCIGDPIFEAKINNRTNHDILIHVYFNKTIFEKDWNGPPFRRSFSTFLKTVGIGQGVELLNYDSSEVTLFLKVVPNSSWVFASAFGWKPHYEVFQKLIIYSGDTISLDKPELIENAMVKTRTRHWEMNIKK